MSGAGAGAGAGAVAVAVPGGCCWVGRQTLADDERL